MEIVGLLWRGSWMLGIPLLSPIYRNLNRDNGKVHTLVTDLDRLTPLIPPFIVPYFAWYGFIFAMLVWLDVEEPETYIVTLTAILLSMLTCYGIYAGFQTVVPRPSMKGTSIFSRLTEVLYNWDKPYNAFPSIHVTTSSIMFLAASSTKETWPSLSVMAQTMSGMIILSTVFLKQHVLLDVVAGMLLGHTAFKSANSLTKRVNAILAKLKGTMN